MAKKEAPTLDAVASSSVMDSPKLIKSGASGNGTSTADMAGKTDAVNSMPVPLTPQNTAGEKRKYHVSCYANTPLAFNELDVEAASEAEADHEFFKANGISATHAPRKITLVS